MPNKNRKSKAKKPSISKPEPIAIEMTSQPTTPKIQSPKNPSPKEETKVTESITDTTTVKAPFEYVNDSNSKEITQDIEPVEEDIVKFAQNNDKITENTN